MNFRYIGDIVGTHGVKGEVRIISDIEFKEEVLKPGRILYIGKEKQPLTIERYRHHKIYEMITFEDIHDINDVIIYKGESVYFNKEDVTVDGYFSEDFIGLDVYYKSEKIGTVKNILKSKAHDILSVVGDTYTCLIPNVSEFIESIDLEAHQLIVKNIEGLLNEN